MTDDTEQNGNRNTPESLVAAAVARAEIEPLQPSNEQLAKEPRNDLGNARRLIARFGFDIISVDQHGWYVWDGTRWNAVAGEAEAMKRAHMTAEAIRAEAEHLPDEHPPEDYVSRSKLTPRQAHYNWAVTSGNHSKATAMLATAEHYLRRPFSDFDVDRWALNCKNGTLRLNEIASQGRYCEIYDANRDDRITKCLSTDFDPNAQAPGWEKFVADILPERDVAEFVQKSLGYCLSADTSEQRVLIFEGQGANGKSTMLEVVARILDDYAATTPIEMFLHKEFKSSSGPTPDVARLPGVRLVRASEPEPGARLSESMLKQWTGGENMIARELHRDFFEFQPSGKLILSVNIRPVLVGKDHGTRRRIVMVPFTQTFNAGADASPRGNTLTDELMREAPGILNWLLDGFRMWWETGFKLPDSVKAKTAAYFDEMDPIGSFVAHCLIRLGDGSGVTQQDKELASELYEVYKRFAHASNEEPRTKSAFGRRLKELGIPSEKIGGQIFRTGVIIREDWRGNTNAKEKDEN